MFLNMGRIPPPWTTRRLGLGSKNNKLLEHINRPWMLRRAPEWIVHMNIRIFGDNVVRSRCRQKPIRVETIGFHEVVWISHHTLLRDRYNISRGNMNAIGKCVWHERFSLDGDYINILAGRQLNHTHTTHDRLAG
jgi:hypothetical protein